MNRNYFTIGRMNLIGTLAVLIFYCNSSFSAPRLKICPSFIPTIEDGMSIPNSGLNLVETISNLEKISKDLEVLLDADKNLILPMTLQLISGNNTSTPSIPSDSYAQVLLKVKEVLKKINSRISFRARIAVLPETMCSELADKTKEQLAKLRLKNKRNLEKTSKIDHITEEIGEYVDNLIFAINKSYDYPLFTTVENDFLNQTDTRYKYSYFTFAKSGHKINTEKFKILYDAIFAERKNDELIKINLNKYIPTPINQTDFELIGYNFNIDYEVDTLKGSDTNEPIKFKANVSGGIILSAPEKFEAPINIPIQLQDGPIRNLELQRAHFENDPKYPSSKNYVTINFENMKFSNQGPDILNKNDYISENPKMRIHFTDGVEVSYNMSTSDITLTPKLDNPMNALLIQIRVLDKEYINNYVRLNLPIDHLVLEFQKFDVYTEDSETKERTLVGVAPIPKIRFPLHQKGEKGGIRVSLQVDTKNVRNRIDILSFHLNGDSILNQLVGGKNLADQGINAGYSIVMDKVATNVAFFNELIRQSIEKSKAQ